MLPATQRPPRLHEMMCGGRWPASGWARLGQELRALRGPNHPASCWVLRKPPTNPTSLASSFPLS